MQNLKIKNKKYGYIILIMAILAILAFSAGASKPTISVEVDGQRLIPGDPLSSSPIIQITINSTPALQSHQLTVDSAITAKTPVQVGNNYYVTYEVTGLADGIHGISIEATNISGEVRTYEMYPLYVQSAGALTIQGTPLNYPNPFDPGSETTTIGYTLSKSGNISLRLFDLSGNLIYQKNYTSSQAGGRAGYNEVTWDGKSDAGNYVGTGIYIYLIIADGKVAQNGKGKITVFKQ